MNFKLSFSEFIHRGKSSATFTAFSAHILLRWMFAIIDGSLV